MKKFNAYQYSIIQQGLQMYATQLKAEIADMEAEGKHPIMTQGFVDMQVAETIEAVKDLTKKSK